MSYDSPVGGSIRSVQNGLTTLSCPFTIAGFLRVGARTSVCQLDGADKPLAVISPVPYGPECDQLLEIAGSRNVKYIIALNGLHFLGVESWKKRFPRALVIGPACLEHKQVPLDIAVHKDVSGIDQSLSELMGDPNMDRAEGNSLRFVYIHGHANRELCVFHAQSKTLLVADLLFNNPGYEQYQSTGQKIDSYFNVLGRNGGIDGWFTKFMCGRWLLADKDDVMTGLNTIRKWPFQRISMCHGEVIEKGAKEKFCGLFHL